MKILVAVASKHGAAREIGQVITDELREHDLDATLVDAGEVKSLEGVDAVVLGSAVYMSQWLESARNFVSTFNEELRELPLWAFSCGLAGVPVGAVQDPRRLGQALLKVSPIDHQTFKGRLELANLSLRERSIARLASAPEGDYREWDKIRAWARGIAEDIREHLIEPSK